MKFETDNVTIFVTELLKQTRPGHHLEPMTLMRYSDAKICTLSHLEKYREVTKSIRKSNKLQLVLWNHTDQFPLQLFPGDAYQGLSRMVLI